MASSIDRFYWDACAWIAYIIQEKVDTPSGVEYRGRECKAVIEAAENGKLEIVTSAFSLVEVCKRSAGISVPTDNIAAFFENDYLLLVHLDREVGELARELMNAGHSGLKPQDAVHLASALVSRSQRLHTYDKKLLGLSMKIDRLDGGKLDICMPHLPSKPLPLLDGNK